MQFGKRLGDELKARGMKQVDLCDLVTDLTEGTISAIIKNDYAHSKYGPAIAKALGLSLHWLMTGEGDKHAQGGATMQASEPPPPAYRRHKTQTVGLAPTAVTLDLPAECLVVWEQLQQLSDHDREVWLANLEIAAGQARLAKLKASGAPMTPPPRSTEQTGGAQEEEKPPQRKPGRHR